MKFENVENHLFFSVVYGLMFYKGEKTNIDKTDTQNVFGDDLYFDLKEIESESFLDKTMFGLFERCHKINEVLLNMDFSLGFLSGAICTDF